jgi:hypothetical protein
LETTRSEPSDGTLTTPLPFTHIVAPPPPSGLSALVAPRFLNTCAKPTGVTPTDELDLPSTTTSRILPSSV